MSLTAKKIEMNRDKLVLFSYLISTFILSSIILYRESFSLVFFAFVFPPLFFMCKFKQNSHFFNNSLVSKRIKATYAVAQLYFTFALVANGLFMQEPLISISIERVFLFILFFIVLYPWGAIAISLFEKVKLRVDSFVPVKSTKKIRKVWINCTVIIFVILILVSFAFYPAFTTNDGSAFHWPQALGITQIGDDHPAFYTLLIRLVTQFSTNIHSYVVVQMFMFSIVVASFLSFVYSKGADKRLIYTVALVLAVLPNNYMTLMLMSKNPMHTISLIWVFYLLVRLVDDPVEFSHNWLFLLQLPIAVSFVHLIRHNGFPATFAVALAIGWFTWKYYRSIKYRLVLSFFSAVLFIFVIIPPIYRYFDVYDNTITVSDMALPLVSPLASAISNELPIPEEIYIIMDKAITRDGLYQWAGRYHRFNADRIGWGHPRPDFTDVSQMVIFRDIYLRMLFEYPAVVILDRLDSMESLWNIFQSRAHGSLNRRYTLGIFHSMPNEIRPQHLQGVESTGWMFRENFLTPIPRGLVAFTSRYSIFDMFIWRSGIYIVVLFWIFLFVLHKKHYRSLFVILPTFSVALTLVPVLGWQIYQYTWFIAISTMLFAVYVLFVPVKRNS